MVIRGVLFDLDDTLYSREASFLVWATRFAGRLGLDDPQLAIDALVAQDNHGYVSREAFFAWARGAYPTLTEPVETLVAAFYPDHAAGMVLDERTAALLDALDAQGIPYGVITNGSASQQLKIDRLGLERRARCIFISELFGSRKPDAAIFLAAADALGVRPAEILFVGDNPVADISGAAALGMTTAWLPGGLPWPADLDPPDYTITSLDELIALLGLASG